MSDHAQLSPSKAHRWRQCPGSIREEAKYPESTGPAAIDGTHTHTLLEHCISEQVSALTTIGQTFSDNEGTFIVDTDRARRVEVALDYVKSRVAANNGIHRAIAETQVDPAFLVGRSDMGGTCDIQILGVDELEIIDYKDGMNKMDFSAQLEQYALGVIAGYRGAPPISTVRLTVIQPKLSLKGDNPISTVETTVEHLVNETLPQLIQDAAATDDPNAPLKAGEHCKFCRARGACSANSEWTMAQAGVSFSAVGESPLSVAEQAVDKDPAAMSNDEIRQLVEAAPLLRQLLEAAENEALRRFESGQDIAGLKLVEGRGSRYWGLPEDEIAQRLIRMGAPKGAVYETKLVSPAKAEKLVWKNRKGEQKQLSDRQLKTLREEYIAKKAGKPTVAPESDPRPAIRTNAAPLFSAVEQAPQLPDWLKAK